MTESPSNPNIRTLSLDSVPEPRRTLASQVNAMTSALARGQVMQQLATIAHETGGVVTLLPELSYLPALIGADHRPIFLYNLVEAIEEFLDLDRIAEEYPSLSYEQVIGAIKFLRRVSQINGRGLDID